MIELTKEVRISLRAEIDGLSVSYNDSDEYPFVLRVGGEEKVSLSKNCARGLLQFLQGVDGEFWNVCEKLEPR